MQLFDYHSLQMSVKCLFPSITGIAHDLYYEDVAELILRADGLISSPPRFPHFKH